MLRLLNRQIIRQGINVITNGSRICSVRNYSFGSSYPLSSLFRNIDRQLQEIERQFDRVFWNSRDWFNNFRPIGVREHPSQIEAYRVLNPIVEEDGVKKFLLELDVRRFKPEEVIVKTNAKENTLTIEAKHKDDETKFEYLRKITLPQGVISKEMTCHFTVDGILQIKAPYNAPQEAIAVDTEIPVKHE
ncbi:Hsp20/alpha crystallin family protein [Acanthocheilonema viteae]